jgi:hypothetical protein
MDCLSRPLSVLLCRFLFLLPHSEFIPPFSSSSLFFLFLI